MKKTIFLISILGLLFSSSVLAQTEKVDPVKSLQGKFNRVEINFFYSRTCPYCAAEMKFLAELEKEYPEIEIKSYEVIYSQENKKILQNFYEKYNVPEKDKGWVPVTFTPNKYFIGFSEQIGREIEGCLKECLGEGGEISETIKIPLIGEVEISQMSLPVLTVVLGALDGFNPCAMWILLFLIAFLINTRSRKRMWLVGGTFIAASGIVYYLILTAWLNLFLVISYVNLTRILIGVLAVGVGVWQIRSFIKYQPGVCKVTDGKTGVIDRMRNKIKNHTEKLALSPLTFGILIGVAALAVAVNLIEFFCSAGLPAIFTRVLTLSELSSFSYYLYLLLYTFVFMLDDLIIFSLAVITLSKIGFTEKYNYWATLIGGLLILILGILLIFKPELLMFT
jgi:thiol-disulfide isomerase/thioredoxin